MKDTNSTSVRPNDRRADAVLRRLTLAIVLTALLLAGATGIRPQSAAALPTKLPQGVSGTQPVNYHLHGDATIQYVYTSTEGQRDLLSCNVDLVPKWHLILDGTLDSVGHTLTGTFQKPDVGPWQQWDSNVLECGPDNSDQSSCPGGCGSSYSGSYWVTYNYLSLTGFPGTIPGNGFSGNSFQGTYDDHGNVRIEGHANFGALFVFLDCADMKAGVGIPCDKALGFTPRTPNADDGTGFPRNAKLFNEVYGNNLVVITGSINIDNSGASIHGNMNLPSSVWADCCIVSDPLFLSDFNHVSITADPVPLPAR